MGITALRHSHSTGQWRIDEVLGVAIEFTRRVMRGSTTSQIEFDDDGCHEQASAMTDRKCTGAEAGRPLPTAANP